MGIHAATMLRLLAPTVLVGTALWARPFIGELDGDIRVVLAYLPYLLSAAGVLMALQFGRGRMLLAAAGVGAFYWLVQNHLQVSLAQPDAARLFLITSLAVPLLSLYLLLVPERGIFNNHGLVCIALFVALAGACFPLADWLLAGQAEGVGRFSARPAEGYVLSIGASILFAGSALVGLAILLLRDGEVEAALLGILAALYAGLAFLHLDQISLAMGSAAGLVCVWGVLRSSYSMAYRDELTGLLGRRALNERLRSLGRRYSIAMLDVDHFKRFNDTHGHDVGDEVLKLVASRVRQVGHGGTAYRYGGEEFCIIFPRRSAEDCAEALDAVRECIAQYQLCIRDRNSRPVRRRDGSRRRGATSLKSSQVSVTVSAGLAARSPDLPDAEAVLKAADKRLYRAKRAGRNRVVY